MTAQTIFALTGGDVRPSPLNDSLIVLIDAQNEYVHGLLVLSGMDAAVAAAADLLAVARAAGAPIVHIVQKSAPQRPLFTPGTDLADIIPALAPLPGETVIEKRLSNAFAGTTLEAVFRASGRRELILAGFMTHNCVTATARGAEDRGIRNTVVAAATATRDLPDPVTGAILSAAAVQAAALAGLSDRVSIIVPDAGRLR